MNKAEEPVIKRRRIHGTHRWSDHQTESVLHCVAEAVKENAEFFEKPTAQAFYKKIAVECPALQHIPWNSIKIKMRHLKDAYVHSVNWQHQTGVGVEGDERSVEEHIKKICPHYDILHNIFGSRKGINPKFILQTNEEQEMNMESVEIEVVDEVPLQVEELERSDNEENLPSSPDAVNKSSSSFNEFKKNLRSNVQTSQKKKSKDTTISQLLEIQQKKLELEDFKCKAEVEYQKKQLELRKLEIEKDERVKIEIAKIESEERIKRYELELKFGH